MKKEDLINEFNLDETIASSIVSKYESLIADEKLSIENSYKDLANKNAEGILNGVAQSLETKLGLSKRNEGEKYKDYLERVTGEFTEKLTLKEKEVLSKASPEIEKLANEKDSLLKKLAEIEPLVEYKTKYETLISESEKLKIDTAFDKSMPKFDENANEYELKAKTEKVKNDILSKYEIKNIEGVWKAVDKENHHKIKDLNSLIDSYDELSNLKKGVTNPKPGFKPNQGKGKSELPLEIGEVSTKKEGIEKILLYLDNKYGKIGRTKQEYTQEYSKYMEILRKEIN